MKIFVFAVLALVAFAGNSILNRLALGTGTIDAASFTVIRLLSGGIALIVILKLRKISSESASKGSWFSSALLFIYAMTFSYAYIYLDTGIGALILFAAVQITMMFVSYFSGNKLGSTEWLGMFIAFIGFIYLVLPSLTTPSLTGFILMTVAGISWGGYTLLGRSSKHPLSDTTYNFIRTLPFVIVLFILTIKHSIISQEGLLLAILSGAITSGLGYTVWYIALSGLTTTRAAVIQLLVPILSAVGGVLFVNEAITFRLLVSSLMVLGGILLVVVASKPRKEPTIY